MLREEYRIQIGEVAICTRIVSRPTGRTCHLQSYTIALHLCLFPIKYSSSHPVRHVVDLKICAMEWSDLPIPPKTAYRCRDIVQVCSLPLLHYSHLSLKSESKAETQSMPGGYPSGEETVSHLDLHPMILCNAARRRYLRWPWPSRFRIHVSVARIPAAGYIQMREMDCAPSEALGKYRERTCARNLWSKPRSNLARILHCRG